MLRHLGLSVESSMFATVFITLVIELCAVIYIARSGEADGEVQITSNPTTLSKNLSQHLTIVMLPPYIPGLHTSALPKDRITQPKVPQHSTQGSSTLNPQLNGTLDSNMRLWFKNVSAYSTSTCPSQSNMHISRSKMPKSPVRAENSVPEAQTLFVERSLRDLFDTPGHGSVCAGGRHQIGPRN